MLRNLKYFAGVVALCAAFGTGCSGAVSEETPVKVIFDTDMGNDIDDALALDMLYKYADEGRITLLGITSNREEHPASVEYIDILNTFYGSDLARRRLQTYDLRLRCAARKCGAAAPAACVAGRR